MSEESRLGRERTIDSPTEKLLMSVAGFADELEREKARQRTRDAMLWKARARHVTGGRIFGTATNRCWARTARASTSSAWWTRSRLPSSSASSGRSYPRCLAVRRGSPMVGLPCVAPC